MTAGIHSFDYRLVGNVTADYPKKDSIHLATLSANHSSEMALNEAYHQMVRFCELKTGYLFTLSCIAVLSWGKLSASSSAPSPAMVLGGEINAERLWAQHPSRRCALFNTFGAIRSEILCTKNQCQSVHLPLQFLLDFIMDNIF